MSNIMENFHRRDESEKYIYDGFMVKQFLDIVKEGNLSKIKQNVESLNLDVKYIKDLEHSHNALYYATLIKDDSSALQVMKYLVDQGIDPLVKDYLGQTAIYFAAREGKAKCCRYLIEKGSPLNEGDLYSQTPIFYACRENKIDVVELLIDKGADIRFEDKIGQTCIFYAVRQGHYAVIDFLIKKGIDVNKLDKKKQGPLNFARKHNQPDIAELLIKHGAHEGKETAVKKKLNKIHKKTSEDEISNDHSKRSKPEYTKSNNLKKKVILVKILDDGSKYPLDLREIEELKIRCPDVFRMLNDPVFLDKIEKEAPEALKSTDSWEKVAKKILSLLWKVKQAEIFYKPVDPIDLGIPDYFDIIKFPMDFSTIKKKLNSGCYTNCKEFAQDLDLVFDNCIIYNGEKSIYGECANNVRTEYKKLAIQFNLDSFK